jgi:crotonobetainyl-CoA:carnitine CoA-transferase CaiB-like acyl-CoA transferase
MPANKGRTRMLEGLKVVEFATYIAAPGAGGIMADWGAEVIKIEPPGGDPIRKFFDSVGHVSDSNPVFELDNRGKKGVVLDIAQAEGREAMVRLVREADIFLTNVRPGALKRARLDYENLKAHNPRLIYCSVTGYGLQGPEADRPGFDVASFWSRSGVAGLTIPKGAEPFPIRTAMGDHITSLSTVSAVLAAVIERGRTGAGRLVETSLLRTGVYAVGSDMAIQLRFGRVASNRVRAEAINPVANFFMTKDGRWLCLVPRQGSADWAVLTRAIGRDDLAGDERFANARARRTNAAALVAALDEAFSAYTLEEAGKLLDAQDYVWAPVQRAAEVAADPQAEAAGCFVDTLDGTGGTFRAPASPARFPGALDGPRGPAPSVGQHTDEVLSGAGFTPAEIAAMRASGAAA